MKTLITVTILGIFISSTGLFAGIRDELERYIRATVNHDTITVDRKCGTRYPLLIHEHWDELSESARELYKTSMQVQPVRERSMETTGGHFRLHWDETGFHAVPAMDENQNNIPDYIDSAAVIFENVWDMEINQLGFLPPPLNDGETDSLYDVYFSNIQYYGITWFPGPDIPSIPGENYASYMEVDNDFAGFPSAGIAGLKVTAAHEFHHAIQLGYNVRSSDFFFYEMTSTSMEEVVYPEINDYFQYLPYLFNSISNSSFTTYNGQYEYGNMIYLLMLEKKYGSQIVRQIWDEIRERGALEALGVMLEDGTYNSSWLESLSEYGEWLYFTGTRNVPGSYFDEAGAYPQVRIFLSDRLSFSGQLNSSLDLSNSSNRFFILRNSDDAQLYVTLSGAGAGQGAVRILTSGLPAIFSPLNRQTLVSRTGTDSLAVIVTNTSLSDRNYALQISSGAGTEIAFGPNPVIMKNGQNQVIFQNLPGDADVFIYSVSGNRVSHLPSTGNALRVWDLTNENGRRVASGVYLVLIKGADVEKIEKLTILQ